jgi:ssDNA-binding Zn-finger/Zn-ribbon topoisomerase 1
MSTLLLSLLLIFLIAVGMIMGRGLAERFENPPATEVKLDVSPALAALIATQGEQEKAKAIPQVSQLKRDLEIADAQRDGCPECERSRQRNRDAEQRCPKCKECPDMSQYIRMDEIPCWNCTLP